MENSSGMGNSSIVPAGVKGWSWGAFLLSVIWGLFNGTYISLLCLIPFVGFIFTFVLGFKGREWAWQNKKWESVEQFNEIQKKWSFWAVATIGGLMGIAFLLGLLSAILAPHLANK